MSHKGVLQIEFWIPIPDIVTYKLGTKCFKFIDINTYLSSFQSRFVRPFSASSNVASITNQMCVSLFCIYIFGKSAKSRRQMRVNNITINFIDIDRLQGHVRKRMHSLLCHSLFPFYSFFFFLFFCCHSILYHFIVQISLYFVVRFFVCEIVLFLNKFQSPRHININGDCTVSYQPYYA